MKLSTLIPSLLLVASGALAQTGVLQQQQPPAAAAGVDVATASDAHVGARDVLDIKVFQDPSLNSRVTVTDDGKITVPLVGKIDVSGMKPAQIEQVIKTALE